MSLYAQIDKLKSQNAILISERQKFSDALDKKKRELAVVKRSVLMQKPPGVVPKQVEAPEVVINPAPLRMSMSVDDSHLHSKTQDPGLLEIARDLKQK